MVTGGMWAGVMWRKYVMLLSCLLFIQLNAQLDCSRNLKTYIKMLLHVSV